jgi:two-component system sensor histidine kinase UhpB
MDAFGRLTIFNKILIANVTIVVLGAVAGTWITIYVVRDETDDRYFPLALFFAVAGVFLSIAVNFVALRAAFRPLALLQEAAHRVRQGDLSIRIKGQEFGDPEVRELAETLNGTLEALARDRIELNLLASQVIKAQEDERRRIARELHDDTAQVLFAQLLRLSAFKNDVDPTVKQFAEGLEEMTSEALESVRRLAYELRPPALDDLGLEDALGELIQRCSDQTSIPIEFNTRGPRGRLPADVELVLYRITQEALQNVAKHARATCGWVTLDRSDSNVSLSVRDNGIGFDSSNAVPESTTGLGLGLFGMEERATLVGGSLRIRSSHGKGTEIFAIVPIAESASLEFSRTTAEVARL